MSVNSAERFSRSRLLFGDAGEAYLAGCRVAVFGLGGVGGHAAEAVVRSGIGAIDLIDGDVVSSSNLNRQLLALESTVGQAKVEAAASRFADINPKLRIVQWNFPFDEESAARFDFSAYDYVIDAIDSIASKILLIETALTAGTPIISSMGTGNKLDPTRLEVADISETSVCPLAKAVRKALRRDGFDHLKVVYSRELPISHAESGRTVGSVAFVPSAAGLILAAEVIKDLLKRGASL